MKFFRIGMAATSSKESRGGANPQLAWALAQA